jgi:putative endonuclease
VANEPSDIWFIYLIECKNGRLYTGITPDLEERFRKHSTGKGAMFTRLNAPLKMIAAMPCSNRSAASKLEYVIKKLTHDQKRFMASKWTLQDNLPSMLAIIETQ